MGDLRLDLEVDAADTRLTDPLLQHGGGIGSRDVGLGEVVDGGGDPGRILKHLLD